MGWSWAGALAGLRNVQDRAERKAEFERQVKEQRRNALLPYLLEQYKLDQTQRVSAAADHKFLVNSGLSPKAVRILEESGQVGMVKKAFEDAGNDLNRDYVSELEEYVLQQSGGDDTKLGPALVTASKYDQNKEKERALSLVEIVQEMQESDKPFETAQDIMDRMIAGKTTTRSRDPLDISFAAIEGIGSTETNRIDNAVGEAVQGITGNEGWQRVGPENTLIYQGDDSRVVKAINILKEQMLDAMSGPQASSFAVAQSQILSPLYERLPEGGGFTGIESLFEYLSPTPAPVTTPVTSNTTITIDDDFDAFPASQPETTEEDDEEEQDFMVNENLNFK